MKKPNIDLDGLYTIPEVCDVLGIDRRTLRRYTIAGSIVSHVRVSDNRIVYKGLDIHNCYYKVR